MDQGEFTNLPHFNQLKQDLSVTKDVRGLLRCEGRLKLAPLPYEAPYPVLLNPNHRLAELTVVEYRKNVKHSGVKQTIEIRQKLWICSGRS